MPAASRLAYSTATASAAASQVLPPDVRWACNGDVAPPVATTHPVGLSNAAEIELALLVLAPSPTDQVCVEIHQNLGAGPVASLTQQRP